jgi:ribosomal protein S12 methylthiotransferase accessory factor YcaO
MFPGDLPGFTTEPSEFAPFDTSDVKYQWRVGARGTGAATIVPVELVYFPVHSKDIGRQLCGTATSSGVAAHISIEEARRSALLELIERDAFVRHWIARRPPAFVTPPDGLFDSKLAHLKRVGIEVSFGQLDAVVPVIYCAMISADGARLAFGLAADTVVNAAVEKAFLDAYGTYLTAQRTSNLGSGAHLSHYLAYQDADSVSRIGWFFNGRESTLSPDVNEIAFEDLRSTTVYVSLDSRADTDLVAIRALNSSLRSIWFGSRWQPSDDPNGMPHFFS